MSDSTFHVQRPSRELFKFPPDSSPLALPPPQPTDTFAAFFPVSANTYNALLSYKIPIAIGTFYAIAAVLLNWYNNNKRLNRPWAISKTRSFYVFVILHNMLLALYSSATALAMARALRHVAPGFGAGLVENVDACCKLHGPRGIGNAATFNSSSQVWEIKNSQMLLGTNGEPDSTDVGRLWNEGLAFWGWLFYLSKFYEVVDTAIVLAKGRSCSTLQIYHHTGAMLCVWAGIRFMSPPIWLFVFMNAAIHSLMYTYYTACALGVRVPGAVKRALTTMQIAQCVIGVSFATLHLFVSYTVPVSTPYTFARDMTSAAAEVASAASSSATSIASAASVTSLGAVIRKLLLRAAGEEGMAENVRDDYGSEFESALGGGSSSSNIQRVEEVRWRNDYVRVRCIDTTGQSFAIWLNFIYLVPLIWLFVRFFIRSYIERTDKTTKMSAGAKAVQDASHDVKRVLESEIEPPTEPANVEPHQNGSAKQDVGGLSTTNPRDTKISYAQMIKS